MAFDAVLNLLAAMIYRAVYHTLSKHPTPPWVTEDDLIQEGRLTLLMCINKFNMENPEAVFIPYFRNALANNLRHYMLDATKKGMDPSLHSAVYDEDNPEQEGHHSGFTPPELTTHPGASTYVLLKSMLHQPKADIEHTEFLADVALMCLYLGKAPEEVALMLSQPVTKVQQAAATAKTMLRKQF